MPKPDLGLIGFMEKLIKIGNTSLPLEKKSDLSKIEKEQGGRDGV